MTPETDFPATTDVVSNLDLAVFSATGNLKIEALVGCELAD
jgi:hypothetical protein